MDLSINKLTLGPFHFKVVDAWLNAFLLQHHCFWQFRVMTEGIVIEMQSWEPIVYSDQLISLSDRKYVRWTDVLDSSIHWDDCYNSEIGIPNGSISLFGHQDINLVDLSFGKVDRLAFRFTMTGLCDLPIELDSHPDLPYDEMPLEIVTTMRFRGVKVDKGENFSQRVKEYFSETEFVPSSEESFLIPK